jgi:hypothetical protein
MGIWRDMDGLAICGSSSMPPNITLGGGTSSLGRPAMARSLALRTDPCGGGRSIALPS